MARIISKPQLTFKCEACGTVAEADEHEFHPRHTMPPTWEVRCPYCALTVVCSPTPLIAKLVGGT